MSTRLKSRSDEVERGVGFASIRSYGPSADLLMRSKERIFRIREIERTVAKLQKKGWRMEAVKHTDEEDEPFRTSIHMSCLPKSNHKGIL